METNKSTLSRINSLEVGCEYNLVVIQKTPSENAYGIATQDPYEDEKLCIKVIGPDKELALSILDVLNRYKVPYVHFLDVIHDLMNE